MVCVIVVPLLVLLVPLLLAWIEATTIGPTRAAYGRQSVMHGWVHSRQIGLGVHHARTISDIRATRPVSPIANQARRTLRLDGLDSHTATSQPGQ